MSTTRAPADAIESPLSSIQWLVALLVLFWLSILGHEGAHFGTAALVYTPDELRSGVLRPTSQLMAVSAGPLFTLLLLGVSLLGVRSSQHVGLKMAWSTLVASAASRIAIVGPGTLSGTATNDERTIGRILELSPRLLWSVEAPLAFAAVIWVAKAWPKEERPRLYRWVAATLVVGWSTTLIFGPKLGLPI